MAATSAIRLFKVKTGKMISALSKLDLVATAEWSPDSRRVVTAHPMSDHGGVKVWDIAEAREIATFHPAEWGPGSVWTAGFSPEGTHIITGAHNGAWVWDVETGTATHVL